MAQVPVELIKELRAKTGAGMGDCRKALIESDCDVAAAVDFLRKSGLLKAAKKATRATKEGKIAATVTDHAAVLVEVLCETDFVAKNEKFLDFCDALVKRLTDDYADHGDISATVQARETDAIGDLVTTVGENIQIRRALRWQPAATTTSYLHLGGKIGVLVEADGDVDDEYMKNLAMHVAAFSPTYLRPEDVPQDEVDKEKEIYAAQPEMEGKPEQVLEKILSGKIQKWYKQVCLLKQAWIWEQKKSVEKINPNAKVLRFARWQVGEDA